MSFEERFYRSVDGLKLYYRDYGGGSGVPVLCMHGLTRNSKDFEDLAPHLAAGRRVLAADVRGRGRSERDPDYMNYHPGTYVEDMWRLMDDAGVARAVLIGTSMGGLMAMVMAAMKPERVAGMVLNDVGPEIDPAGLERISSYAGKMPDVNTWEEAAEAIAEVNRAALPHLTPDDWMRFARRTFREDETGRPVPDYDPAIGKALEEAGAAPADLWSVFDALKNVPMLVIRGALSDILAQKTVEAMKARKPGLEVAIVPGVGHAPMLDEPEALQALEAFLVRIDRG
ncbi:MAG: alpha/beta fold hydrolase [Alphaproteobacteria bacterium]